MQYILVSTQTCDGMVWNGVGYTYHFLAIRNTPANLETIRKLKTSKLGDCYYSCSGYDTDGVLRKLKCNFQPRNFEEVLQYVTKRYCLLYEKFIHLIFVEHDNIGETYKTLINYPQSDTKCVVVNKNLTCEEPVESNNVRYFSMLNATMTDIFEIEEFNNE